MEIKRDIHLDRLIKSMHNGMIKVVTGIRRCGKSYLLMNIFKQYLLRSGVKEDHIITLDLENRRNKKLRDPDALLQWIDSQIVEYTSRGDVPDNEWYYVMLDEVQMVPEFEDVLNSYLSIPNVDVYVTGSNSKFFVEGCNYRIPRARSRNTYQSIIDERVFGCSPRIAVRRGS